MSSRIPLETVKDQIISAIAKAAGIPAEKINLDFPERDEHGDYSSNNAMVGFDAKKHKSPKEYAQELVDRLRKDKELGKHIEKIEVAGSGFINFFLSEEALLQNMNAIEEKGDKYGSSDMGKGKTVVIDYSAPNIAKAFGVGHLRSTIIGQALYNLYKFLGYKTVGDNHLGDWGTQFGMIIAVIKKNNLDVEKLSVDELEKAYVKYNKETEENPELRDVAKEWFKKLEEGDSEAKYVWQKAKETSLAEFQRIYDLLGVNIDYAYGESFYEDKMDPVIKEARKKGLVKKSEGAEIIEFESLPPSMLVKSDGATTYFTRDLATIKFRIETWKPDIYIYEVGSEQSVYFKQLFEAVGKLGWIKDEELVHVGHGLFLYGGKKMSTRSGGSIKLEEVLTQSIKKAKSIIEKSESSRGLSEKEKDKVAKAVGVGAIKYYDLLHHPTSNINFDWEKIFVLEGNSGPYLQYTFARTQSVLAKSSKSQKILKIKNDKLNSEELSVLKSLTRFSEVVEASAKSYSPNLLANYLFDLASRYNTFYARHRILSTNNERTKNEVLSENKHRIIKGGNDEFRLKLTLTCGQVIKNGLTLLGIQAPERM